MLGNISHMEHALNMGKHKVGPYYVDGYAESEGIRCAYEFQGYFHSYPTCHRLEEICPRWGVVVQATARGMQIQIAEAKVCDQHTCC